MDPNWRLVDKYARAESLLPATPVAMRGTAKRHTLLEVKFEGMSRIALCKFDWASEYMWPEGGKIVRITSDTIVKLLLVAHGMDKELGGNAALHHTCAHLATYGTMLVLHTIKEIAQHPPDDDMIILQNMVQRSLHFTCLNPHTTLDYWHRYVSIHVNATHRDEDLERLVSVSSDVFAIATEIDTYGQAYRFMHNYHAPPSLVSAVAAKFKLIRVATNQMPAAALRFESIRVPEWMFWQCREIQILRIQRIVDFGSRAAVANCQMRDRWGVRILRDMAVLWRFLIRRLQDRNIIAAMFSFIDG